MLRRGGARGVRVALVLLALAGARWLAVSQRPVGAQSGAAPSGPTSPLPARVPAPALQGPWRVEVHAGQGYDGPVGDAVSVCSLPAQASDTTAGWRDWAPLGGRRLAASSNHEALPVYAARIPAGLAIVVANRSDGPADGVLDVRLAGGVYGIDRCVVAASEGATGGPDEAPAVRWEGLESVILGGRGAITKPCRLAAGETAVYRVVNRCQETADAFDAAWESARSLARSQAAGRRILVPLRECRGYTAALANGVPPSARYQRLKAIHRALLMVAHAQALCQNFVNDRRGSAVTARQLDQRLDRLEAALTGLSAGCLNLVPGLTVSTTPGEPDVRQVTVSLTNAGGTTVSPVKLGASAPAGCAVSPDAQALFGSVSPGQSVRATFRIRLSPEAAASGIGADIAYFASRVPAHIRLKAI